MQRAEELINPIPEWLSRTQLMVGADNLRCLHEAHVLVAGLGGVGSAAAEMLCRSGIGKMTIADSDVVQSSNINRQLVALHSTIGKSKTDVMKQRLLDINPQIELAIVEKYLKDHTIIELLAEPFDYVVDAIDTLSPKVYFIYYALKNNQSLISSMGAGGKLNPALIRTADFRDTSHCKLAYDLRKRLRRLGIESGFQAVYSIEQTPSSAILETGFERNKKSTIGTISYMPVLFGCWCASLVINAILRQS